MSADVEGVERTRARERMFAVLSHEIRTPLNGVIGMAGLLASTPLDATQTAYLTSLRDCAEHLLGLVGDVLDLSKLESGRIELEPAATDVEHMLQGVCELLSPRAHASGLEIGAWVGPDVPLLHADDGRLRQILFNLAGNAVKLTQAGGVELFAERRPSRRQGAVRLAFCVADTGPGLAPADRDCVFQEFYQTAAGERAGGAGLGLAIVKRLADAFGGEVAVEDQPGGGARFRFEADFDVAGAPPPRASLQGVRVHVRTRSPIVKAVAARQLEACGAVFSPLASCDVALIDAQPDTTAPPAGPPALVLLAPEDRDRIGALRAAGFAGYLIKPLRRASLAERVRAVAGAALDVHPGPNADADERAGSGAGGMALRVLLVEDNAVNALLARALLVRTGCTVDRAASGEEALAAARAHAYDLILMDMRMPGMDGLEATRRLRAAGCPTPVVALTANAFDDDRRACLDAGMEGFLTKPLDPAALEAMLTRLRPVTL